MIRTELKICMSADFAAGSAWLILGEHAPGWIDEICKWEIDQDTATIVALPTNAHDRRPLGALVICSPQREHSFGVSPTALPFRRIGENLFVPANAQLSPLAELHEIEDIFHRQNIYVWHPNVGLVVAGPEEQLTIPDLFQTPEVSDWLMNAGCAGTNWPSRLISIELEDELMQSLESMMQTQRDGIGERSNEIDQLEPLPEEGSLNRTVESLKQSIARMIGWVCSEDAPQDSNQLKDTAKNSVDINREPNALQRLIDSIVYSMGSALPNGLLDRIEGIKNWADNQLNDARDSNNTELYRLKELLENNPDEGLKYALPINATGSRGSAPGGLLGRRKVDFDLSRLDGNPAGSWNMSYDLHFDLNQKYRELARREIQLGRFRRAAYIYGNLLSDYQSAANTLKQGGHFREAAMLYQEKLHSPLQAVECLKLGGYYSNAITLFESLDKFEEAGDLYAELEQLESANECWARAANDCRDKLEFVSAARIECDKIGDLDEALDTLRSAWPQSQQAIACVKEGFRLMGEHGRSDQAVEWVSEIEDQFSLGNPQVIEELSKVAKSYPDRTVRDKAIETTYQLTAKTLQSGQQVTVGRILRSLGSIFPADRLLQRDCQRYQNPIRSKKTKRPVLPTPNRRQQKIGAPQTFDLDSTFIWLQGVGTSDGYLVLGYTKTHSCLHQVNPGSPPHSTRIERYGREPTARLTVGQHRAIAVVRTGLHADAQETYVTPDLFGGEMKTCTLGTGLINSLTAGPRDSWLTGRFATGSNYFLIDHYDSDSRLLGSYQIETPILASSLNMECLGGQVFLGAGNQLITYDLVAERQISTTDFESEIVHLASTYWAVTPRLAVALERGVRVLWLEMESDDRLLCSEMESPHVLFTKSGHLVVVAGNQCEIYHSSAGQVHFVSKLEVPDFQALMHGRQAGSFSLLTRSGKVMEYSIR